MGKYFGYSSAADEHIGSYTVRIQPAYRYSKKGNSSMHHSGLSVAEIEVVN